MWEDQVRRDITDMQIWDQRVGGSKYKRVEKDNRMQRTGQTTNEGIL